MTERNLTRAEIPMCPECGAVMKGIRAVMKGFGLKGHQCLECKCFTHYPDYGYYPPDVSGVVRILRSKAQSEADLGLPGRSLWFSELADRLEGKDAEVGT